MLLNLRMHRTRIHLAVVMRLFHCRRRFFFLTGEFVRLCFELREAMIAAEIVISTIMFVADEFTFLIRRHPANQIHITAFPLLSMVALHNAPPFDAPSMKIYDASPTAHSYCLSSRKDLAFAPYHSPIIISLRQYTINAINAMDIFSIIRNGTNMYLNLPS